LHEVLLSACLADRTALFGKRHAVILYCFPSVPTALRYQPSTNGRFFPVRGGGGGTELRPDITHFRVSAGSTTLSSSNNEAVLSALPRSYICAT
jgi:hypothetical protein